MVQINIIYLKYLIISCWLHGDVFAVEMISHNNILTPELIIFWNCFEFILCVNMVQITGKINKDRDHQFNLQKLNKNV